MPHASSPSGSGRPWEPDERLHDLIAAYAGELAGTGEDAERALRRAVAYTLRHRFAWGTEHLAGAVAMGRLGLSDDLRRYIADWEAALPGDPTLAWWKAREKRDEAEMARLEARGLKDPMGQLRTRVAQLAR
jgi:hypothetical protein